MSEVVLKVEEAILQSNLHFSSKPILIGGRAMEYYDIRKSGKVIDFIITDKDYQKLAEEYPEKRNDLKLMRDYYYKKYTNQKYHQETMLHENSYRKMNGVVFGGMYEDA